MDFLVISGAPSTGKTTAINRIAEWVSNRGNILSDTQGNPLPTFLPNAEGNFDDISIVVIYQGRKIIIHSATDDKDWMDKLIELLGNNLDADIVITSCRDINWERDYFTAHIRPLAAFFLETPLGKITRTNVQNSNAAHTWYRNTLLALHQHILLNNPFSL